MTRFSRLILVTLLLVSSSVSSAGRGFWKEVTPESKLSSDQVTSIQFSDEKTSIRYFDADEQALREFLALVPHEQTGDDSYTILLPMPDGTQTSYSIVESPIMEAALAAKYPEIKTFKVRGIDDPGASGRVDISQKGFRAMLFTAQGRVFIDPEMTSLTPGRYVSQLRNASDSGGTFRCSTGELVSSKSVLQVSSSNLSFRMPGNYITYRIAVAATPEYVVAVNTGGTPLADASAAITTTINRVNEIYERDLGIRLIIVGDNDLLIDVNDDNNFSNDNGLALLLENQIWIDNALGIDKYDIGHIFSTGGGGVAVLESVCDNSTSLALVDQGSSAMGVTGLSNPTGEIFHIDFVAHEIGHQFGAEHSFNGTTASCSGNRSLFATTFEPGSGSTIMAYAGICGVESIQNMSDATFHAGSISQINGFASVGGGSTCINTIVSASNPAEPTANAGIDRTIPLNTAFLLQGTGGDTDGDTLSYQWDQMDAGTATSSTTLGEDFGDNALFRSYLPQATGDRDFPALGTQVADGPIDLSEALPCTARIINFRLTVRDNKSGQATDDVRLTVDGASGPFRITSHDTAQTIFTNSGSFILNWDVANTSTGAVNCANVDIDLLTFGAGHGEYSVTSLATIVSNNGNALVRFPDPIKSSSLARLRVKCSSNIFYDISDADLVIGGTGDPAIDVYSTSDKQTFFNTNGQVFATSGTCVAVPIAAGTGVGGIDGPWLLFLLSLSYCARLRQHFI